MELLTDIATIIGMFEIIVIVGAAGLYLTVCSLIVLKSIYDLFTKKRGE